MFDTYFCSLGLSVVKIHVVIKGYDMPSSAYSFAY